MLHASRARTREGATSVRRFASASTQSHSHDTRRRRRDGGRPFRVTAIACDVTRDLNGEDQTMAMPSTTRPTKPGPRADGRRPRDLRPIVITPHYLRHAEGSAL